MLRVPKLGCNEYVLALQARNTAFEGLLERARNLFLVAVDFGEIEMTVSGLESFKDSSLNLSGLSLPGSEPQLAVQAQSAL